MTGRLALLCGLRRARVSPWLMARATADALKAPPLLSVGGDESFFLAAPATAPSPFGLAGRQSEILWRLSCQHFLVFLVSLSLPSHR